MRFSLAPLMLMFASASLAQTPAQGPLQTGHHGTVKSTGVSDPRYLLSFPAVQGLALRAARDGKVSVEEANAALAGLPFGLHDIEAAGVLRKDGSDYRIAYMVLTQSDVLRIYEVSKPYGASLAQAFIASKLRFDRIASRYPRADLRSDLLFNLVAGYVLNWDGLRVGTELGMRAQPTVRPNGDRSSFIRRKGVPGATRPGSTGAVTAAIPSATSG